MKSRKVNNFLSFFLYRFFAILLFTGLTYFVTGRIADMDLYIGDVDYEPSDYVSRTIKTIQIFTFLQNLLIGKILLVIFLTLLSSTILYFLFKSFVDKNNFKYWALALITPGLLIYTNAPTKELLFFYPTTIYIILECRFLIFNEKNILQNLVKFSILPLLIFLRGYLAAPYALLATLCIFLKNFNIGKITIKLDIKIILIISFICSTLLITLFNFFYSDLFKYYVSGLYDAFDNISSQYRSDQDYSFISDPLNSIYIQYLSLFPTIDELINKPYQLIIVIESFILIYVFLGSWSNLFKSLNNDKSAKKIVLILITFIGISYFTLYGIIGSFNVGSSQRLRVNFIPIGIFFPLILEKNIREKFNKKFKSIKNQ